MCFFWKLQRHCLLSQNVLCVMQNSRICPYGVFYMLKQQQSWSFPPWSCSVPMTSSETLIQTGYSLLLWKLCNYQINVCCWGKGEQIIIMDFHRLDLLHGESHLETITFGVLSSLKQPSIIWLISLIPPKYLLCLPFVVVPFVNPF